MLRKLTPLAAGLLASTFMVAPAYAQDADPQAENAVDDNVIIVTATRRAQDVQDIPIAVTAVSPEQLEKQGVVNVQDITAVSPSFSTSNAQVASGSVVLRIRGVGTTSNNIGFESAVGIFVDGAYQSRPAVALSEFVDIERVEVLRGPQGTLFGRNTSAGALNITTVRPDVSEFGGFVNGTYGNRDLLNIQGAVNVPIVQDNLGLRLTGAYRERDGYVTVVDANGAEVGDSNGTDQWLVRGQLGWDTDSGIRGRLIFDYSKSEAGCCSAIELLQSGLESAGLFGAVGLGARGGMAAPIVATDPFDQQTAEQARRQRIASANFAPIAEVDQWGVTGEVEFPVSDNIDLIYIGSYRDFSSFENYDSDFTGLDLFDIDALNVDIETMTHELRLQGDAFGGRLSWLVGGYYSDESIVSTVDASLGADYDQFAGALFAGATGGATLNPASPLFIGATPLALFSGGGDASVTSSLNQYTQNSESWSIFTHNVLDITDRLSLTLGARWSDESKSGGYQQLASNPGACSGIVSNVLGAPVNGAPAIPAPFVPTTLILGCFPFVAPVDLPAAAALPLPRSFPGPLSDVGDFNDEELIYTIKLGYDLDDVNLYGGFTHGYKSGGFNLDTTAAIGGTDPRFDSEEVDAYEVGMKTRFLDNAVTLNVALFLEEFSNFQVLEFTGAQFQTFNVPKAESRGIEIETSIRPTTGLTINGALTLIDAKYPSDCATSADALRVQNLCGAELTNAPDIVAIMGANYEDYIGDSMRWFVNGQIRMESDRRTSTQPSTPPTTAADLGNTPLLPFDVQDGTAKINLRAGFGSEDENWTIEAFVNNLTNELTRGVTISTTLRSGSRSAFIQEPRSYGVTVRTRF